jgi:hypothetical protein
LRDPPSWVEGMTYSRLAFAWEDCATSQLLDWLDHAGPTDEARRAVVGALAALRLPGILGAHLQAKYAAPFIEAVRAFADGGRHDESTVARLRDKAEAYRHEAPADARGERARSREPLRAAARDARPAPARDAPLVLTVADADTDGAPAWSLDASELAREIRRRLPNSARGLCRAATPRRWRS